MTDTTKIYKVLYRAFIFFNARLFDNELPPIIISLRGHKNTAGSYKAGSYIDKSNDIQDESIRIDEIALNPEHFMRSGKTKDIEVLKTLVHEMCHMWQKHCGKKKKVTKYHNKEWSEKMVSIGLIPSDTGFPGGRQTGAKINNYIQKSGLFNVYANEFFNEGNIIDLQRLVPEVKKRAKGKVKYSCNKCGQNAWAKPNSRLKCGKCSIVLIAEDIEED